MDTQLPNDRVSIISGDADAQALMLEYDVLDQVSHKKYPDDTISSCIVEHHPTHWLLCARFWGNPNPAENGFSVVAYPKGLVDRFTVQGKLHELLSGAPRVDVRPFGIGGGQN
jgi:hypothetical protein